MHDKTFYHRTICDDLVEIKANGKKICTDLQNCGANCMWSGHSTLIDGGFL